MAHKQGVPWGTDLHLGVEVGGSYRLFLWATNTTLLLQGGLPFCESASDFLRSRRTPLVKGYDEARTETYAAAGLAAAAVA